MPRAKKRSRKSKSPADDQAERLKIIFEYSPIAIWEEDFSALAKLRRQLEKKNVRDIRKYLLNNNQLVKNTFRQLKVLDVNREALRLYGAKTKKALLQNLGKTLHRDALRVLVDEFTALLEGQTTFEAVFKSKTLKGKNYDVALRVSVPEKYKRSFKRVIVTFQDITEQKRLERRLRRAALHDGLTKVLNHKAICDRLRVEMSRARRYHLDVSIMMIDIDHFKKINDEYGHQRGDSLLKKAGSLLKNNLRDVDIIGRYGGDEFLIILPETSAINANIAAARIKSIFENKNLNSPRHFATLSIGITGFNKDIHHIPKDLIKKADEALYQAKEAGRNTIKVAK